MDSGRAWRESHTMRRSIAPFVVSLALASTAAFAQPKPKPPGAPAAAAPVAHVSPTLAHDVAVKMKSGDRAQIRAALDDVRMAGKAGAPAVPAIVDALKHGLDVPLTQSAIETLADVESEAASEVLGWYAQHRNPALRRAAVSALPKTRGPAAVRALRGALADQDAAVRGLAATGLGALKAKEAVPDLFVALDHKVAEAASSIGQLCSGGECEKLADKLGQLPFDVVTGGLDQILFRPATEVSDDTKIKVIGRIRELGTGEANKFLREAQKKWPETASKRVKQSLDQAVLATSGSVGATPVPQ
jgi:HEAT repeat protein